MNNTKLLEGVFDLAKSGIKVNIDNLPKDISKEVVYKSLLYAELRELVKENKNQERIDQIKAELYPKEEEINEEDKL